MIDLLVDMPDPEMLLKLQPEELAGFVIEYFNSLPPRPKINRFSFGQPFHSSRKIPVAYQRLSDQDKDKVRRALIEAWFWLEREGFLAQELGDPNRDDYFVTRKGQRVKHSVDLGAIHKNDLLPQGLLHPVIAEKTWALFLRGEYDTAVFQAFKEVEVAVRKAGGFDSTVIGVDLMRKAFHPDNGPLTDKNNPSKNEREAVGSLFAGGVGYFKNPSSHRNVSLGAEETAETLMFASHLLRIVDGRVK